jgi:hypothetical protein
VKNKELDIRRKFKNDEGENKGRCKHPSFMFLDMH